MIARKTHSDSTRPNPDKKAIPWLRLVGGLLLGALAIWFIARDLSWADIRQSLAAANGLLLLLSIAVFIATVAVKAFRWRQTFYPIDTPPSFIASFWALMVGQIINQTPIRIGELGRVYSLSNDTGISKSRALGTVVVEKTLDTFFLLLTLLILLPWIVVPDFISNPAGFLATSVIGLLVVLYLLTFQQPLIAKIVRKIVTYLPAKIGSRIENVIISGLDGLAALRNPRRTAQLVALSALIAFMHVLLPFTLFKAFHMPLGFVGATLMHLGLTISASIPSTPAKIGIFEGATFAMLTWLGFNDEPLQLAYALVFHAVMLGPQLVLGSYALMRAAKRKPTATSDTSTNSVTETHIN